MVLLSPPPSLKFLHFYLMCISILAACVYIIRVLGPCRGQKRTSDLLELGFQTAVNCHVGPLGVWQVLLAMEPCPNLLPPF